MTLIDIMTHCTHDTLLGTNNDLVHVDFLIINARYTVKVNSCVTCSNSPCLRKITQKDVIHFGCAAAATVPEHKHNINRKLEETFNYV